MSTQPAILIAFLQQTSHIPLELATQIAAVFEHREIAKGEFLLKQGRPANEYLLLASGYMRAWLSDTEGNEITTGLYAPFDVVFEVAGFFQRIPGQENLEAVTDCTGWILSFEKLNSLFHEIPAFREFGRAILVKNFVGFKLRTLSMISTTAEQRYEQLMNTKPELLQHVPLKFIASYLGITDSSLSRIRKQQQHK